MRMAARKLSPNLLKLTDVGGEGEEPLRKIKSSYLVHCLFSNREGLGTSLHYGISNH